MELISGVANARERRRDLVFLVGAWFLIGTVIALLARQNLSVPGLYYDEAVFAGMAKDFVTGHVHGQHMPNHQVVTLAGRPFPLFIQTYLGALKSWMLIPAFSLFGANVALLRATTLFWAEVALLFLMLGTWRWLGLGTALISGVLLAFDPTYFFLSVLDWGAAVPSFVCRFASLCLIVQWSKKGGASRIFFAAFFAGLGFFNKIDFGILLVGTIAALIFCYRQELKNLARRPAIAASIGLGFLLGAGPILFNLIGLMKYGFAGNASVGPGEYEEKLHTMISMYDGSYFYRLMEVGGMFKQMFSGQMNAPSMVGAIFITASVGWLLLIIRGATSDESRTVKLLLLTLVFTTIGVFVFPAAVRIHHAVLVFPLPQLLITIAITSLWKMKSTRTWFPWASRIIASILLTALLANHLSIILKTQKLIRETGGRGLWSNSLSAFCREYGHRTDLNIVSVDWGFNEQLAFLTNGPKLSEAVWKFGTEIPPGTPLAKNPSSIYLLHPPEYAIAPESVPYLSVVEDPQQQVEIQPYFDRQRRIAFYAIRFRPQ